MSGRILVTGGAGFIGSQVAEAFLRRGWRVAVVDDLSTGKSRNLPEGAGFHRGDVTDRVFLEKVFEAEQPQVVSHHAAQTSVRLSTADPGRDLEVNVHGTLNLALAALKHGAEFFCFASTGGAIYGDGVAVPTPEDAACRPASPYGVGKLSAEHYLEWASLAHGLPVARLRYANVYGPRQDPHGEAGVVAIFTQQMLGGGRPVVNGDGRQTRDYVFVGDVVEANLLAVEGRVTGAFNVGTGRETDVNTLFGHLASMTGFEGKRVHGPHRPGEQARSCLDAGLLAGRTGWRARVDIRQGLEATVSWFREHGSEA